MIDLNLNGYSVEMREELRGETALAVAERRKVAGQRLTIATITRAVIRELATSIYKTQPNRFRDVSLEHCHDDDGYKLEEWVEAQGWTQPINPHDILTPEEINAFDELSKQ